MGVEISAVISTKIYNSQLQINSCNKCEISLLYPDMAQYLFSTESKYVGVQIKLFNIHDVKISLHKKKCSHLIKAAMVHKLTKV